MKKQVLWFAEIHPERETYMKILFLQPLVFAPGLQTISGEADMVPGMGVLYIASIAKRFGHVAFEYVSQYNLTEILEKHDPDVVCFSVMTTQYLSVKKLCEKIKRLNEKITIILGGYHPSLMLDSVLDEAQVDYIVVGEGEETFSQLMEYLKDGKGSPEDINGLAFKKDGKKVFTGPRKLIDKLDELPYPSWDILPKQDEVMQISTSRGCPFSCSFCSISSFYGRRFRTRSIQSVIDEVKTYVNRGYRNIIIADDNFLTHVERVIKICREFERLHVKFVCQGRIDVIYRKPEILKILHDAGCYVLALGLESGIQEGLDALNKDFTLRQVEAVARELESYPDIARVWCLMVGTGDENDTRPRIEKSINFALSLPYDFIQLSILTPYPGTRLFDKLSAENRILTYDWDKYDCCHCVYQPLGIAPEELESIWSEAYYRIFVNKNLFKLERLKRLNTLKNAMSISSAQTIRFVARFIRYLASNKNLYKLFERDRNLFEKQMKQIYDKDNY